MPAGVYGAVSLGLPAPRGARGVNKTSVAVSALFAVCGVAMLAASGLRSGAQVRNEALLLQAARMNMVPLSQTQMLCEGHFLDTATGIPEGKFSTLSHPGEMQGYEEPLPADMRSKIDAEVYGSMDTEAYQFVGCIDPDRVTEVKGAVGQYRNEHNSLAHFAVGHDYPFPKGQQWLYQHN